MQDFPVTSSTEYLEFSTLVECSRKTADQLRIAAVDGLLALPRVGMGVGGLLSGTFDGSRVQIVDSVEIPCAHSGGPSFALTFDEVVRAKELAASIHPLRVVGCYCSKTRGPSVLSEPVADYFQQLCPEAWQVLLLLHPSTVEPSRAVMFFRDASGTVVKGAELDLELEPEANVVPEAESEMVVVEPQEEPAPAVMPFPPPRAGKPLFGSAEPAFRKRWIPWALAATALGTAGTAGWVTRDSWLPRPDLTLGATDSNGHLSIRWNPDAVRGLNDGVLSVNDGGNLHSYQLDSNGLRAGMMGYDRKSPRVNVTLRLGGRRAITSFFDPSPPSQPATAAPPSKALPLKAAPRKASTRKALRKR